MRFDTYRFAAGGDLKLRVKAQAPAVRMAGLDGLRAIAVTAVLLFHADLAFAKGGYLGVDLFFVISGFLITGLLAGEQDAKGRIGLKDFYWRRAKRLLPAALAMIAASVLAAAAFAPDALPRLKGDALASLVYVTNWEMIAQSTSYFEAIGRPPLLQHLWSLAIEEQFYILWAPLMLLALPRLGRRRLAVVAGAGALISAAWMAKEANVLGWPGSGDPSRLYFGTDTHGFPLLIGAALGLLWQPSRSRISANPATQEGIVILGLAALGGLIVLFWALGEDTGWLYPYGFLLAAGLSAVLIFASTHRSGSFGAALDNRAMRWIGERSYGIYLWHWPVFMLTRPHSDLELGPEATFTLRIGLTLAIAALSYRYVEMPVREGAVERLIEALKARAAGLGREKAAACAAVLVAVAVVAILIVAPSHAVVPKDVQAALSTTPAKALKPVIVPVETAAPGQPPIQTYGGAELTAVGDSVLLGSSPLLKATLTGADVHATMGWQASDVLKQLQALAAAGQMRSVVLVHLGTNGYIGEDQLRGILTLLADRKEVILVNTHVPRRWMEANNALIDRVLPEFPNTVLVNWRDLSDGQPDYFVSDNVHLTDLGQRAFIAAIMRAGHLASTAPGSAAVDPSKSYGGGDGDLSPTLVRLPQPAAPDAYWRRLARCETGGDWTGSAGGLGLDAATWGKWGGTAFAPTPALATPAQQIAVANRISTGGWHDGALKPAGFTAWRCARTIRPPESKQAMTFTPESVIAQNFHLGERGDVVRDLQSMLGLKRDGIYGGHVRKKHLAFLKAYGLPEALAGTQS
jgi:peptidoglycan/LPS O-acetylase OafA/YrhL